MKARKTISNNIFLFSFVVKFPSTCLDLGWVGTVISLRFFMNLHNTDSGHIFTSLRRFPEVRQSVRATEYAALLLKENRASLKESRGSRPSTAGIVKNPYDTANRKLLESYNDKKICAIRKKMRQVVRTPVARELDEILKVRREIVAVDYKDDSEYLKEFSHKMTNIISPFESACLKLSRAGILDFKALKMENHGILSKTLAKGFLQNLATPNGHTWSIDILESQLKANSVFLTDSELKALHYEIKRLVLEDSEI